MAQNPKVEAIQNHLEKKLLIWRSGQDAALPASFCKELSIALLPDVKQIVEQNGGNLDG